MEQRVTAEAPPHTAAGFASLLSTLMDPSSKAAPKPKKENGNGWADDELADDFATLSYERALRSHARYRASSFDDLSTPQDEITEPLKESLPKAKKSSSGKQTPLSRAVSAVSPAAGRAQSRKSRPVAQAAPVIAEIQAPVIDSTPTVDKMRKIDPERIARALAQALSAASAAESATKTATRTATKIELKPTVLKPQGAPSKTTALCVNNRKNTSVTMRLSQTEHEQLRERADEAGMTVSAYLRSCTLEVESLRAQVKEALAEMRTASALSSYAMMPAKPAMETAEKSSGVKWLGWFRWPFHKPQPDARYARY